MPHVNFEGFVYLNIDNPMVAWNTTRGNYCSPACLQPNEPRSLVSFNMAGLLASHAGDRLQSEMAIEKVRLEYYPEEVSRLSGFFVFDDVESVAELWIDQDWGWHFRDEYLTDIGVSADRRTRVDARWITKIMDFDCKLVDGAEGMIHKYWGGEPHPDTHPIWENLVEGWATVWGTELREKALIELKAFWPNSIKLLEYSANAARLESADGMILPVSVYRDGSLHVDYMVRMVEATNPEFLEKMDILYQGPPELRCTLTDSVELNTPDFSCYSFSVPVEENMVPCGNNTQSP